MFTVSLYFMLYFANQNAIQNVKFPEEMIGGLAVWRWCSWALLGSLPAKHRQYYIIYASRYKKNLFLHARPGRTKYQIIMYIKWLISKKLTELCRALFIQSLKFNIRSKPFQTHSQPTFIIPRVPMKYRGKNKYKDLSKSTGNKTKFIARKSV